MASISNWGRWGNDDQLGTLNLITPEKKAEAARLVEEGISISLSHPIRPNSDDVHTGVFNHEVHALDYGKGIFAMDQFKISPHGLNHTHLDALSHMVYQGLMYNGFTQIDVLPLAKESVNLQPAKKLDIALAANGLFSRGILMDIPVLKGLPYLEPGYAITIADLEAWEKEAGITVAEGDILLIRIGLAALQVDRPDWNIGGDGIAGLHPSAMTWLKERGVAVLGSDGVNEVVPLNMEEGLVPVHQLALVGLGMPLIDNMALEKLSVKAAERRKWAFLFSAAPLNIPGATGSHLNAIATF